MCTELKADGKALFFMGLGPVASRGVWIHHYLANGYFCLCLRFESLARAVARQPGQPGQPGPRPGPAVKGRGWPWAATRCSSDRRREKK